MPRAIVLVVILLAALMLVACGKDDSLSGAEGTTATTPTPTATGSAATATTELPRRSTNDGCKAVVAPEPGPDVKRRRTKLRLNRARDYTAIVQTNCGTIRIRLAVRQAPKTTSSFAGLARNGFFDGLTFHRIAKPGGNDYVIQGGDPTGTGNGGPGYTVVEGPPIATRYRRYVVAMAKTQLERRGTSGSQFFIVTAEEAPLDPDYAILGRVVGGQDVVRRIAAVPTDPASEMPLDPVVMSSVKIRLAKR